MANEKWKYSLKLAHKSAATFPKYTKHETFVRNVARVAFRIAATDSFIYSIGCADVLRPLFPSSSAGIQPPRFSPRSADRLFILARPIKTNNFRSSRGCTSQTCKHRVSAFAVAERRLYRIYERLPVIFLFHVPRSPTFLGLNKYFVNSDISSRIILVSLLLLNIPWNESWRRVRRIKNCHGRSTKLLFENDPEIVVTHDPSFLPLTDEIGDVDGESSRLDWTAVGYYWLLSGSFKIYSYLFICEMNEGRSWISIAFPLSSLNFDPIAERTVPRISHTFPSILQYPNKYVSGEA